MKNLKISFMLTLVVGFLFTACSKDNELLKEVQKEQTASFELIEVLDESTIVETTNYAIPIPNDISDEDVPKWIDNLSDENLEQLNNEKLESKFHSTDHKMDHWIDVCYSYCRCNNFETMRITCYRKNICTGERIFVSASCTDIYC